MPERKITINLPSLPKSWNSLSTYEIEEVNRLMRCKQQMLNTTDPTVADRKFKLQCFLLFTGLELRKRTVMDEKDEVIYLFRRKGIVHCLEQIPMKSWQVNQWIDSCFSFLDNPQKRTIAPYATIRLYGKKFKAPAGLLTDVTYGQYFIAQNLLVGYWNTLKLIDKLIEQNATHESISQQMKKVKEYQCKFLASLFTPSYIEKEMVKEGRTIRVNRRIWMFDQSQIENHFWRFRKVCNRMFPVMLQFFQSVQLYYSYIFPDLFTSGSNSKKVDVLQMEVDTVNAIMKYQGFGDYNDVYDSESVRILGVLNTMSKDAKQVEEMNRKMKSKK